MVSYLLYLTAHISDKMAVMEEHIEMHVNLLQEKLDLVLPTAVLAKRYASFASAFKDAKKMYLLSKKLGLQEHFPQALSVRDALQIREDTLKMSQNPYSGSIAEHDEQEGECDKNEDKEHTSSNEASLPIFIMLQKIVV